jgi:hypothetical protein
MPFWQGILKFSTPSEARPGEHSRSERYSCDRAREGDRRQVASLAGMHLVGRLADRLGLTAGFSAAVPPSGERAPAHDRGRLLVQVAVMLAGGGRGVADMAPMRDQPGLFGRVAPTICVLLSSRSIPDTPSQWSGRPTRCSSGSLSPPAENG